MILNLKLLNKQIGFKLIWRDNKFREVIGYTNATKDGLYIVTLDYDGFPYTMLQAELERLQREYALGDFHIFSSSKGKYHAVCLDKVDYETYVSVLFSSSVDENYKRIPIQSGKKLWVLRVTKKDLTPHHIVTIKSESDNEKSYAHLKLLMKMMKLDKPEILHNYDENKEIIFARYQT